MQQEKIVLSRTSSGQLYANINGVSRSSVTCYFNESGGLVSHTLHGDKLVAKLGEVIATRGVVMPAPTLDAPAEAWSIWEKHGKSEATMLAILAQLIADNHDMKNKLEEVK